MFAKPGQPGQQQLKVKRRKARNRGSEVKAIELDHLLERIDPDTCARAIPYSALKDYLKKRKRWLMNRPSRPCAVWDREV